MAGILILEDEADLRELYRLSLEAAGHEILASTGDPEEPLRLPAGGRVPDLVILDERLGSSSGTAYLDRFRSAFPGARILLVSADPEAVRHALRSGVDEATRKPVTLRRLVENVDALLHRH